MIRDKSPSAGRPSMSIRFGKFAKPGAKTAPVTRPEELIRAREAAGDRIVFAIGLGLAVSSASFFVYALQTSTAQPNLPKVLPALADHLPVNRSLAAARRSDDLDPTTTGSVPKGQETNDRTKTSKVAAVASPQNLTMPPRTYVVWRVNDGIALVEGPDGLREVAPGAVLPGAGEVLAIQRSDTGWVVVTSETIIGTPPI
jgi:hypothetical protein